jgi:hypothetical protein
VVVWVLEISDSKLLLFKKRNYTLLNGRKKS